MSPQTASGRAMLEHMTEDANGFVSLTSGRFHIGWVLDALAKDIPAIEREARESVLDALEAAVGDAWEQWGNLVITNDKGEETGRIPGDTERFANAVLAAIQQQRSKP